ncbi:hypothetical protein Hdeb2414_s0023g00627861 [Helianthus debilis subsp. tardiflorus]
MDLNTINKCFNHITKRKKTILLLGALGFTTYGAYKLYNSPSIVNNRKKALKVLTALASVIEFFGESAETLTVISNDLKSFIKSDSDQIPCSLKQVFKITNSDEFVESVITVTTALTVGISRGYHVGPEKAHLGPSFPDRALDKLFSPAGTGFAAVVVGSFSRNMVMGLYAVNNADRGVGTGSGDPGLNWVDVVCDDKFRKLIGDCIQQFVTTMVSVYLDKTMDINTYDEILASLTDPKHEEQVRSLMSLICNGAVETFVRTSHQVLTNSNSNSNANANATSSYLIRQGSSTISKVFERKELVLSKLKTKDVLGLTRRVTLATVKSFLGFMLSRVSEGMKTRFLEAYRYLNAKSLVVMTVWISMYLHMISGPWSLMQV